MAFGLEEGIREITQVRLIWMHDLMRSHGVWVALCANVASAVVLVAISCILTLKLAPAAAGSGLPLLIGHMNGAPLPPPYRPDTPRPHPRAHRTCHPLAGLTVPGLLDSKTLFVKVRLPAPRAEARGGEVVGGDRRRRAQPC